MEFGICLQSVIAVRSEPSHRSEMVTQVLFGELMRVGTVEKEWARIQLIYDDYEGWIPCQQLHFIPEKEFLELFNADTPVTRDLVQLLSNTDTREMIPILAGSSLPGFSEGGFVISGDHYFFDGEVTTISHEGSANTLAGRLQLKQEIVSDAKLFLNAPYLWGGRTPFGIDCSGLMQLVYKLQRIKLLRDASQQALLGETVSFLSETEPGDLAFFDDDDGKIIHVGMLTDPTHIIHASGKVRIDSIDHNGIYNNPLEKYTHKLRLIKRMV